METKAKQFRKRSAILQCLRSTHTHPSAEMLHQMLQAEHPDISLATVYRNLALFKNQGIIQSLGTVGGIERFDANTEPHVHFICTRCGSVTDLPQITVPQQLQSTVESTTGGRVAECQLSFSGVCQSCCQAEKTA
jgi:Fur family peroxide stress response transcriptional regulator